MSVCRCTATEVCFPCREREAHEAVGRHSVYGVPLQQFYSPVYSAPRVSPPPAEAPEGSEDQAQGSQYRGEGSQSARNPAFESEAPDVEPATDEPPGISGLLERQREIELGYQGVVAGASQVSSSREVEPASDEQIARDEARAKDGAVTGAHRTLALIARLRQTEERFETAVRWAERLLRTVDEKKDERDEARAEAARLREQFAAMQAADAGAFW